MTNPSAAAEQKIFKIVSPKPTANPSLTAGDYKITSMTISMREWCGEGTFKSNPRQRNTESHAQYAVTRHLSAPKISHLEVRAALCLEDNTLYKLDGHTRAYMWEKQMLDAFKEDLMVLLYEVPTIDEVKDLYNTFDSQFAVEKAADKVTGAWRENNLVFKSKMLSGGRCTNAMRVALGMLSTFNCTVTPYAMAAILGPYLTKADELLCMRKVLKGSPVDQGMLGAIMLTLMVDPVKAEEFWTLYMKDLGIKDAKGRDAVLTLRDRAVDKTNKHGGDVGLGETARMAVSAFSHWKVGKRFGRESHLVSKAADMDLSEYIRMAHKRANISLPD